MMAQRGLNVRQMIVSEVAKSSVRSEDFLGFLFVVIGVIVNIWIIIGLVFLTLS